MYICIRIAGSGGASVIDSFMCTYGVLDDYSWRQEQNVHEDDEEFDAGLLPFKRINCARIVKYASRLNYSHFSQV